MMRANHLGEINATLRAMPLRPKFSTDFGESELLLGYTKAATACAKSCNNFWKISALTIFVGIAAFPSEIANLSQVDALMSMLGLPIQVEQKGTGNLFGLSLGYNEYCIFGSFF